MDVEVRPGLANELRRRQPQRGDKWHLGEVVLTIKGKHHYLWRAVDQNGHVLDILMQSRRSRQAAKCLFRKLLKGLRYALRVSRFSSNKKCFESEL
ncbi:DDE-type integrase/transposase/recombinase [Massilia scottii]|uniref:DDE-type integrase/transposase/recombinase n=1 Tax=Massilia scottii TaxID=3057166 RepID=UPI0035B655DC